MADWLLILAPLLVLGVVLIVGFAGCDYTSPVALPSLAFVARVPNTLEVVSPGVRFTFTRPTAMPETHDVSASTPDGSENVFTLEVPSPSPEEGGWTARCSMAVTDGGQTADAQSIEFSFLWDFELPNSALVFRAQGSPLTPPFRIGVVGLQPT